MALPRWALVSAALLGVGCTAPPPPSLALRTTTGSYVLPGDGVVSVKWLQFCEQSNSVSQASWLAASRGNDGWELVSMSNGALCYKRPVPIDNELAQRPAAPSPKPMSVAAVTIEERQASSAVLVGTAPSTKSASPALPMSSVPTVIEPGF